MKVYLILLFCYASLTINAQTKITNNIKNLKTLNIKNGNAYVGKIIINQVAKTQVYISKITQYKDSTGIYTTKYKFISNSKESVFNFSISMTFDSEIFPPTISGAFTTSDNAAMVNTVENFDGKGKFLSTKGNINSDNLVIMVKSNNPLFATIYGIDGSLIK